MSFAVTQFTIGETGEIIPNPGHEAAWSQYEQMVLCKYTSVRVLMTEWIKIIHNMNDCKIFVTLLNHADTETRWWVVENFPKAVRAVLYLSQSPYEDFGAEYLFKPEMLTYLRMVA